MKVKMDIPKLTRVWVWSTKGFASELVFKTVKTAQLYVSNTGGADHPFGGTITHAEIVPEVSLKETELNPKTTVK